MFAKLKQYKEFIAILVFFLGGFFWLDSQFPKKSDLETQIGGVSDNLSGQILNLQCLLKKYMKLTQLQINAQTKEKTIDNLRQSVESLSEIEPDLLSPRMRQVLNGFTEELEAEKAALSKIASDIEDIQGELKLQSCGSG
jgi:hypothetical protein